MEFYRVAHQTIMDGTVVRYKEIGPPGGLNISASRNGIVVGGHSPTITDGGECVKSVIDRCAEWHLYLAGGRINANEVDKVPISEEPACVVETHSARFGGDDTIIERREADDEPAAT